MTAVAEPQARLLDLVVAEWIKLRSLRSTWWVLGLGTVAVIAINVSSVVDAYDDWARITASPGWVDPNGYALTHSATGLLMLAAGCVGAVAVVGEYGTGLIRTTLAAVPARVSVVLAKAVVLVAVFAVVGTIVALASFLAGQLILDGRGVEMSLAHDRSLRGVAGTALLPVVCALTGLGVGALIRHTAAAVAATGGVLLLLPTFFSPNAENELTARVAALMPTEAWSRLLHSVSVYNPERFPPTIAGSWLVYAGWSLAGVAIAVVMVRRREP
jgi:ABC-2 type transport system permease protein